MKFILLLCLMTSSALVYSETLSLNDVYKIGFENNYQIKIWENDTLDAHKQKMLGYGAFLPKINATANITNSQTTSSSPFAQEGLSSSVGLQGSWMLFDGFKVFHAYRILQNQSAMSQVKFSENMEQLMIDLTESYLSLLSSQMVERELFETVNLSNSRFLRAQKNYEIGAITEKKFLDAQSSLLADSALWLQQVHQVKVNQQQLNLFLNRDPDDDVKAGDSLPHVGLPANKEKWASQVIQSNRTLKLEELEIRNLKLSEKMARAVYWPVLSAKGSVAWLGEGFNSENSYRNSQIGLEASWNLFNGFSDGVKTSEAKHHKENAQNAFNQKQKYIQATFSRYWSFLEYSENMIKLYEKSLESVTRNLEMSAELDRRGAISSVEFREIQLQKTNLHIKLINTKIQRLLTYLELCKLSGQPLDTE